MCINKENQPLVSVGIPTYNRPAGLHRTLECITQQTYPNLEIIVSDNCSPDVEIGKVVQSFIEVDHRIKYFRQPKNIGASKLSQDDIDEHIEQLSKIKRLMPRYQNIRFLGTVAAMVIPADAARYAYRQGIFVIGQSGDDMVILNDRKFQSRDW
jgi:glycosyltransferase involved in cell wall biosynthesis